MRPIGRTTREARFSTSEVATHWQPVAAHLTEDYIMRVQDLRLRWFGVALALAISGTARPMATAKPTPPDPRELTSKIEEYMAARVKRDHFSGSILVARDGKILFSQGYGMANLEHDVPNTPHTKFRLGSITKQFTSMAIMILQERGKLNVQDKVKKYLPDAPKAWDEITIHHLLSHTSGIPNYTALPDFLKTLPVRVTLKELIAKFKDKPLDFKPGEKFNYSNSGYVVLGQIIETASGQNYSSFLKESIFDPLRMNDTGYDNATAIIKHRASGYTRRLGIVLTNCDYVDMSIPHAAGSLYSTVEDIFKWDQALSAHKLVSTKSYEAMFTPVKDNYGYGWMIDKHFDLARYEHGGGIMGFVTIIERYPDEKLLVVALSNLENSPIGAIGTDLAAIALGQRYVVPREPKEAKVDPAVYDGYVGQYEADVPGKGKEIFEVSRDGSRLFLQPKGKSKVVLAPESETTFYIRAGDSEARIVKDPAGKVTHMAVIQNGQEILAKKLAAKVGVGAP
jgi:CubicO group peptidase (beta-lactamase class C family)